MAERLVYASIPVNVNSLNCIVIGAGARSWNLGARRLGRLINNDE
jgi:hypothetical protein